MSEQLTDFGSTSARNDPAECVREPDTEGRRLNPVTPSSAARDDAALVAGIACGDTVMLGLLYDRYSPVVLALLRRILGAQATAEELLQEVFLQVWRRAADYQSGRGTVLAWLLTIARNRALDVVRSAEHRRVELRAEPVPPSEALPSTGEAAAPDEEVDLQRRTVAVRRALSLLTMLQRQAIELAYYEGLSHSEIAARLDEPLGTIKSRIAQAMARLRQTLAHTA